MKWLTIITLKRHLLRTTYLVTICSNVLGYFYGHILVPKRHSLEFEYYPLQEYSENQEEEQIKFTRNFA
jgi:hypothetical protein